MFSGKENPIKSSKGKKTPQKIQAFAQAKYNKAQQRPQIAAMFSHPVSLQYFRAYQDKLLYNFKGTLKYHQGPQTI